MPALLRGKKEKKNIVGQISCWAEVGMGEIEMTMVLDITEVLLNSSEKTEFLPGDLHEFL